MTRWKAPALLCAALSPFMLAGCSQTTSHGMSVAGLTDSITPTSFRARPYRYTSRDRECLQRVMFFESNRSSRDGMVAVGTVVMNRLRSGKHGDTVCAVVGERNQFAPGVMTRKMDSRGATLAKETAEAVLKGERSAKLKNAMFFHTAGLKFPYKNMHYVLVAGGNSFYEKRTRNWQPLPPETMVAYAAPSAAPKPSTMIASADPAPVQAEKPAPRATMIASASIEPAPAAQAFAALEPPMPTARPNEAGFALASAKPEARPTRKRMPQVENIPFALASADEPARKPQRKIAVPTDAPVPTARASIVSLPSRKVARKQPDQFVQVAAEEPLASRFGGPDDGSTVSLGFAQ